MPSKSTRFLETMIDPTLRLEVEVPDAKATWWAQATPGVTYVRCSQPAKYLPGQVLNFLPFDVKLDPFDNAIWTRAKGVHIWPFAGNNTRAILMAEAINEGIPAFMEVDDNYTIMSDVPRISEWRLNYRGTDEHSYEICSRIAKFASGIICSTPFLAQVYSELNDNVHVARNCVDPEDWPDVEERDDGILRIGWAGSDSHQKDAHLLKQAFRWLVGRPNVEVVVLGMDYVTSFPAGVRRMPWTTSLQEYRNSLQVLDVMLCPTRRTFWSDGKSDLKALEAAMAGACSVVSDSPSYDLWQDRTFVCSTENDWERVVKHLYKNRDEVLQMKADQRKYVLEERTIEKGVKQWEKAISSSSMTTPTVSSISVASGAGMS